MKSNCEFQFGLSLFIIDKALPSQHSIRWNNGVLWYLNATLVFSVIRTPVCVFRSLLIYPNICIDYNGIVIIFWGTCIVWAYETNSISGSIYSIKRFKRMITHWWSMIQFPILLCLFSRFPSKLPRDHHAVYDFIVRKCGIIRFTGLPHLEQLHLSSNLIHEIDKTTFEDVESLQELSLHNNLIKVLRNGTFNRLRKLKVLNISGKPVGWYKRSVRVRVRCAKVVISNIRVRKRTLEGAKVSAFLRSSKISQ